MLIFCLRPAASVGDLQKKIAEFYIELKGFICKPEFKGKITFPNAEEAIITRMNDIMKSDSPIVLAGK